MKANLAHRAPQAERPIALANRPAMLLVPPAEPETMMHPQVYWTAIGCWCALLAVFWITFWVSANALFMVAIGTFYALVFFGVPYRMSRIAAPGYVPTSSFQEFLRRPFAIIDGQMAGREALLQVVLVPVALTLGGTAMGIIIRLARAAHGG